MKTLRRIEFIKWLKSTNNLGAHVKEFLDGIVSKEITLMDVIGPDQIWNEYEAAVLAKKLLADGIEIFSPNCITISIQNITPTKKTLVDIANKKDSEKNFTLHPNEAVLEEYTPPINNAQTYYGLGVLLYALITGEPLLSERFRGVKRHNLASSLKRFFSKEAYDDSFKLLVLELVDLEVPIEKSNLVSKLNSIIKKFEIRSPYFISTQMVTSSNQITFEESLKVSLGQLIFNPLEHFDFAIGKGKEPDTSKQIDTILAFIDQAAKESDVLLLPELSMPRKYLKAIKRKLRMLDNDLMIISGLSFDKLNATTMLNQAILIDRQNEIVFNKLQPSPTVEAKALKTHGMRLKPTNKINIYTHKKFGRFAVLICYDFLSLPIQDLLYKNIDSLFILSFNADVSGFEYTAEAFVRMSLINVVIVNCGNYGGSLGISPLRDQHKRVRLLVKGNDIDSINTIKIPINSLYQYKQNRNLNTTDFLCENGCISEECKIRFIEYPAHFEGK